MLAWTWVTRREWLILFQGKDDTRMHQPKANSPIGSPPKHECRLMDKKYAVFVDYSPDAQQKVFDDKQEAEEEYETLVKESDGIPVYLCEVIKHSCSCNK